MQCQANIGSIYSSERSGLRSNSVASPHGVTASTMDEKAATGSLLPTEATLCDGTQHDDMDIMLLHTDFPKLIGVAVKVKKARSVLGNAAAGPSDVRSDLKWDEVRGAVSRMQEQLLRNPHLKRQVIPRGIYPVIDGTVDDAIATLQKEWDHLQSRVEQDQDSKIKSSGINPKKRGRAKKEAIAVKYSKWQTDILMAWMIEHIEAPFPDPEAIQDLMDQTGLNQSQVVNWTTNVRKRNRKATCEGGKKPHHFIDFLFLVQHRDETAKGQGKIKGKVKDESYHPSVQRSASFPTSTQPARVTRKPRSLTSSSKKPVKPKQIITRPVTSPVRSRPPPAILSPVPVPLSPVRKSRTRKRGTGLRKLLHRSRRHGHDDDDADGDMGQIDPLPLGNAAVIDEDMLKDFSDIWLCLEREPTSILPSVTEDSSDPPGIRLQPDLNVELVDISEDIHSWASSLGLAIEV